MKTPYSTTALFVTAIWNQLKNCLIIFLWFMREKSNQMPSRSVVLSSITFRILRTKSGTTRHFPTFLTVFHTFRHFPTVFDSFSRISPLSDIFRHFCSFFHEFVLKRSGSSKFVKKWTKMSENVGKWRNPWKTVKNVGKCRKVWKTVKNVGKCRVAPDWCVKCGKRCSTIQHLLIILRYLM